MKDDVRQQFNTTTISRIIFILVSVAFTNLYVTQPVLPVLQAEFGASESLVSLTVSAVIIGIAISNMPFGILADRYRIQPILITGGLVVGIFGIIGATVDNLYILIFARFCQGLALPALMTCVAAYISRILPTDQLNIVMGTYVAATVTGGLGGRLLGGWLHPPAHWRYALLTAGVMIIIASLIAARYLPDSRSASTPSTSDVKFSDLLKRFDILRIYIVVFCGFLIFSSLFNYLPFRLSSEPLNLSTEFITALYLSYLAGVVMGPAAGKLSNRIGNGKAILIGVSACIVATLMTLISHWVAILVAMLLLCAGFFALHAAASGALNSRVLEGKGRANALYILFYYIGGFAGITLSGQLYERLGWESLVMTFIVIMILPIWIALLEIRQTKKPNSD